MLFRSGLGNVTKFLFDYNTGKFDKMCMITMKNENLLKAFMSETKFILHLNRFYKTIINFINNDDYDFYVYKATCLILTANSDIPDDDFIQKLRILQNYLSEFKFSSYVPGRSWPGGWRPSRPRESRRPPSSGSCSPRSSPFRICLLYTSRCV